jgi:hypothetical protein
MSDRVERAEAEIRALVAEYAMRMDAGDFVGVGALFARATWRNGRDPGVVVASGATEITGLLARTVRLHDGSPREQHLTTNVVIDVDADHERATARSVYVVFMAAPGFPLQATGAGRYLDRFGRDESGWSFRDRLFVQDLRGDTSAHVAPGTDDVGQRDP